MPEFGRHGRRPCFALFVTGGQGRRPPISGDLTMEQWLIAGALLLIYLSGLYVAGRD